MRVLIPADLRAPAWVALGIVRSCFAPCVGAGIAAAISLILASALSDSAIASMALTFLLHLVVGLIGSFALHEATHSLALTLFAPGIQTIEIVATAWRFSLTPVGTMTGRQVMAVALAGPLSGVAAGMLLFTMAPASPLGLWYLGHALFLLPIFGDGRAVLSGLRHWRIPREVGAPRETRAQTPSAT